jgi:hypothetical protein
VGYRHNTALQSFREISEEEPWLRELLRELTEELKADLKDSLRGPERPMKSAIAIVHSSVQIRSSYRIPVSHSVSVL